MSDTARRLAFRIQHLEAEVVRLEQALASAEHHVQGADAERTRWQAQAAAAEQERGAARQALAAAGHAAGWTSIDALSLAWRIERIVAERDDLARQVSSLQATALAAQQALAAIPQAHGGWQPPPAPPAADPDA